MAKGKETVSRTLLVALVLSIVFSVVVSTAAVVLRPAQVKNQNLDIKTNILAAAGMLPEGAGAEEIEDVFPSLTCVWLIWTRVNTWNRPSWRLKTP